MLKTPVALLASLSMATTAIAAAPEDCVTEKEAAALLSAMLPDLIGGLRDKCAAHLPTNAYLVSTAGALIARYKVVSDQQWPVAKQAFGRISGEKEAASLMPDHLLRPLIGSLISAELFSGIKPGDCGSASRITESLAPLPPENISTLMGAVLSMASGDTKDAGLPICRLAEGERK